ncbi:MAG: ABC transporter ATP-binding protein [Candidatus Magasanikbacteria bacterium]|nr:ABC transporter ATP-binding protein [Candidatus Magasanikbacteria bacterium]
MSRYEKKNTDTKLAPLPGSRRGPMTMSLEKPKNFRATLRKLFKYLKTYRLSLFLVIVLVFGSALFAIIGPKFLGSMTNQVVDDYARIKSFDQSLLDGTEMSGVARPTINFARLSQFGFWLLLLYLASLLFDYGQAWVMTNISQKITYNFRQEISRKINRLPLKYFDKKSHGDVLSRITNDVDMVSQGLSQSLTQVINSIISIIGYLAIMLWINWLMTLAVLVMVPFSFFMIAIFMKKSQKHFKAQQEYLGSLNGHIEEMYSGHLVMKVFNGESESLRKFGEINDRMYESAWKSQFLSFMTLPLVNLMGNLSFVGVSVLGGYLALHGRVNIGDIQAFILYVRQFNQPMIQVANISNVLQSTTAAAERVFEFLDEDEELADSTSALTIEKAKGEVEFSEVVFGYNSQKPVIKNFNLHVSPGQRIAIVGPTGAGKTTLVNLLMRFYDLNSGSIKVDGVDIRDMKRSSLRKLFGMVLQDTWLFNGTIMENISYGKPEARKEEVVAAAKAAHADQFIRTLPKGYDLVLNEEANNISQGEKQLITIARAMLVDPSILILDEATSSVDTRTEVLIQEAMEKLMVGRTSFVIAHRLSTIRKADVILVMNEGQLIEQGKHEELIAKNGFYADLYRSQFLAPEFEDEV